MSLANMIGGLMREGLSPRTMDRLRTGANEAGSGLESTLGGFLGRERVAQAKDWASREQVGGLTGAQAGGLGALIGALAGGGVGGAARGGADAVLGSLAWTAYKSWRAEQAEGARPAALPEPASEEIAALSRGETEELVLSAMIMAAKSDGRVDEAEMERIFGRLDGEDGVTPEDRAFVKARLAEPVDPRGLAAKVARPEVAMELYLAALLAIDLDHEGERRFLADFAEALSLDAGAVGRLHRMTGSPGP